MAKFDSEGTVQDRRTENGRDKTGRLDDVSDEVQQINEETLCKASITFIMILRIMVRVMLALEQREKEMKYDLKHRPYKITVMHHLKYIDVSTR